MSDTLVRTQMYLKAEDVQAAKIMAKQQKISLAELFRRTLSQAVKPNSKTKKPIKVTKLGTGSTVNFSKQIDSIYDYKL